MKSRFWTVGAVVIVSLLPAIVSAQKSTVGAKPPKNAIVLFDGKDASEWCHRQTKAECGWDIVDGALVVKRGLPDIMSKREFGDYQLHLEFWLPLEADHKDQARSNSGVYNHGRYEIQILDNYNNTTYPFGGVGALYGQKDPDKNAVIPPEQWNTYDITFRAPRFDKEGKVTEKPRITVLHNGVKIHDNVVIEKTATAAGLEGPQPKKGPILLQNHGSPVRYRNIWIVPKN